MALSAAALLLTAAPFACASGGESTPPTNVVPSGQPGTDYDAGGQAFGDTGGGGSNGDGSTGTSNDSGGSGNRDSSTGEDSGSHDAASHDTSTGDAPSDTGTGNGDGGCTPDQNTIYVITDGNVLYRFNATARTFTKIAKASCSGNPLTLAVDRQLMGWVVYDDGSLRKVNVADGSCSTTSYAKNSDFPRFALSFLSTDGRPEKLYAGDDGYKGLATIDTSSLKLSFVGGYDGFAAQVALTGTADGRLFALFPEADPFTNIRVGELDPSTGKIKNIPKTLFGETAGYGWAIVHWGGQFWVFTAPDGDTKVMTYSYDASDWTTVKDSSGIVVVGAATASCDLVTR